MAEFSSPMDGMGRLLRSLVGGAKRSANKVRASGIPEGALVYAVGDIHGRSDLLRLLVGKIDADHRIRSLVSGPPAVIFLGDYVDRGPDSRGVIEFLLHELPSGWDCRFLKGNHEDALLTFLRDPKFGDIWRDYGGLQALASYGVMPVRSGGEIDWPATARAFETVFPREHFDFLSRLSLHEAIGDYIFVHAGVRPRVPLEYQSEKDLLWIREEFTAAGRALPQTVVHGHTASESVVIGDGRIGIDTGAYATGKLTAAGFHGADVWYLST